MIEKVQKTDEASEIQYIDIIPDAFVRKQMQVPRIQKAQKAAEGLQDQCKIEISCLQLL